MWRKLYELKSFFLKSLIHKELLLIVCIGFVVIIGVDMMLVQKLQKEQEYRQTLMAEQLQAEIQSALDEHIVGLNALKVVYQNFVDISHYDFQQYCESITTNLKGFRRLMYVDPSMHVRQVFPLTGENVGFYNTNLHQFQTLTNLLDQARNTHQQVTSGLNTFYTHYNSVFSIIPIYRGDQFLGFAVGEISMHEIWEPIGHTEFLQHYRMQLKDAQGKTFLSSLEPSRPDRIVTRVPIHVSDQQWTLLLQPKEPISHIVILQRLSLWTVGLLILFLVYLFVYASRQYKQNLSEVQKQFEMIFKSSPDGILMLGEKLKLSLTNPLIEDWSGLSESQLRNKTFFDLFTCQCPHLNKCRELSYLLCTSDQFNEALPEILETQITHTHDQTMRTLRLNASKVKQKTDTATPVDGFICVLGDISTGKELERVKESYVATLTHDLKTPLVAQELLLTTILSGKSGPVNSEQQKLLAGANDSVQDLLEMVNATLLYYKLESSHLDLFKQPVAIANIIEDVLMAQRPLFEKKDMAIELQTGVDIPEVWVDAVQMKRVFHNILSNALSYGMRNKPIRVTVQQNADRIVIIIRNQGKGIPESELSKIFDRYYSLSRKFKQIGTGLGLYISRRIVELHGGKIWAESELDSETRFFITLPIVRQL